MTAQPDSLEEAERDRPVVVFVHVHYPEVWETMAQLLAERLTLPFRLVITSSLPPEEIKTPSSAQLLETTFIRTDNLGRDIRPFLIAYGQVQDYAIGLKLHTKRSIHRLDGEGWRDVMLESLVPPVPRTAEIVHRLRRDPRIGLVAPEGMFVSIAKWMGSNRPKMERVLAVLGLASGRRSYAESSFAAGSMFWFRREALLDLAEPSLLSEFESEAGQLDGTTAHAIERLTAVVAERRGFLTTPVGALRRLDPALNRRQAIAVIRSYEQPVLPFLQLPPRIVLLADRYLPFLTPMYRRLPKPVRYAVRDTLLPLFGEKPRR